MQPSEKDLMTRVEMAAKLGEYLRGAPYSADTLKKWARRGEGPPFVRIGCKPIYSWKAVTDWLQQQVAEA